MEEAYVDFPKQGLVLLRGNNTQTGESSGTGKSNVNLAIAYALDFPGQLPATELQSWLTDEPMQVILTLETPQGELVISRGKKNSLKFGDKTITGARAISEKLREILGQPPEVLSALTYRAQRKGGLFLSKTDSEKKEFLSQLLGLELFETSIEASEEEIKTLTKQFPALEVEVQYRLATLETEKKKAVEITFESEVEFQPVLNQAQRRLDDARQSLAEAKQTQPTWSDLRQQMDAQSARLATCMEQKREISLRTMPKSELIALRDEIAKRIRNLLDDDTRRRRKLDDKANIARRHLSDTRNRLATLPFLEKTLAETQTKVASIQSALCPTCGQKWPEHKAGDLSTHLEEVSRTKTTIDAIKHGAPLYVVQLETEIQALSKFEADENIEKLSILEKRFIADISSEEAKFQAEKSKALEDLSSKILEHERIYYSLEQTLQNHQTAARELVASRERAVVELTSLIAQTQNKIDTIRLNNEWKNKELAAIVDRREEAERRWQESLDKLTATSKLFTEEKDYVAMVGRDGFLGLIFDEILQEISEEANTRLGRLANVSHVTIRFRTETVQQKGTIKKAIVPLVNVGGHEGKLEAALSGGMEASVHQIVDLAVMAVIQRRSGCMPGWFSMDESGEGQGLVTKESALEVLRTYAQEKLILVIDHSTEIKETFSNFIDIEYTNGFSKVTSCSKNS